MPPCGIGAVPVRWAAVYSDTETAGLQLSVLLFELED